MSSRILVKSSKIDYSVEIVQNDFKLLIEDISNRNSRVIIDKVIAEKYDHVIGQFLKKANPLYLDASEEIKSLEYLPTLINRLMNSGGLKRGQTLVAIGGGIIQDVTCFLASTLLRGVPWVFHPTTLLAQADSCIGSKSSINTLKYKNILGTYHPPNRIIINTTFLNTLNRLDIQSGIGEMLKAHLIDSQDAFQRISADYDKLFGKYNLLHQYIYDSLLIKKRYIEIDEFDHNIRNLFNYGHSFGHAIESATNYKIPHGIAITIGMDLANWVSYRKHFIGKDQYLNMHKTLYNNYSICLGKPINLNKLINALGKDKKNLNQDSFTLILINSNFQLEKMNINNDLFFQNICKEFLDKIKK